MADLSTMQAWQQSPAPNMMVHSSFADPTAFQHPAIFSQQPQQHQLVQ